MYPPLLVRGQRLHRLRIHRHLHFVAVARRQQRHAHARERIHERDVARAPRAGVQQQAPDLPDAERQRRSASRASTGTPRCTASATCRRGSNRAKSSSVGLKTFAARDSRPKNGAKKTRTTDVTVTHVHGGDETQVHEERLFAQVAVPDHEVLAERQVAPERREREAQLSDVVEVRFGDQPAGAVQDATATRARGTRTASARTASRP